MNKLSLFFTSSLITLACALEAVVVESNNNTREQTTIVKTKTKALAEKRDIIASPKQLEKVKAEQRSLEDEIVKASGGFRDEITPQLNNVQKLFSSPIFQDTISKLSKEDQNLFEELKGKILPVQSLLLNHIDEFRDQFLLAEKLSGEEDIFAPLNKVIGSLRQGSKLLREKGLTQDSVKMDELASSYNAFLQKLILIEPKRRADFIDAVSLWSPFWQNLYFVPLSSAKKMLGLDFSSLTYDESKLATKFGSFYFKRAYDMSSPYYFGTESGEFRVNVAGEIMAYLFNRLFIGSGTSSTSSVFMSHYPLLIAPKESELHTEFQHSTSIHADKRYKKSGMSVIIENPSKQYSFMRTLHSFPVLISREARGETFWEWAEKGKRLENFSEIFLHDLWSLYQDGKHNNSHIENGVAQGFDREMAFGFPFVKGKEGTYYPQLRSVFMVGRKEMDERLDKNLFNKLQKNTPHVHAMNFLHELTQIQKQFEEKLRTGKISKEQYEKSGFPLQISTYYVDYLLASLKQLRTYKGKEPPTHREIFRFTSPLLERYYSALYSLYQSDAKAAFNDLYSYSKKTSIEKVLSDELVSGSLEGPYVQMKKDLESFESKPATLRMAVGQLLDNTTLEGYSKSTQVKILQSAWSLFPDSFKLRGHNTWLNIDLIKKFIEKKVSSEFFAAYFSKCKDKLVLSEKELKSIVETIIKGEKSLIKDYLLAIRRSYSLPDRVISLLRKKGFNDLLHEFAEADKVGDLHVLPLDVIKDILEMADLGDVRTRSSLLRLNKWFNQKLNEERFVKSALEQSWRFLEENGYSAFRFFKGAVFERIGLKDFQFAYSDLSGAQFSQSDLEGTLYENCRLDGAKFSTSITNRATFIGPVTQVSFTGLNDALEMNFSKAFLRSVKFDAANMLNSKFDGCKAESTTFNGCDLAYSNFQKATLINTSMIESKIDDTIFAGSTLQNFRLQISEAYELEDSEHAPNFEGATLEDVNMENVFLGRVKFNHATLNRFNGKGIIARSSSWEKVKGQDIDLSKGIFDEADFIKWDVARSAFTRASLDKATILNCSFRESVNFKNATGANIIFNESDLSKAIWTSARLKRPYFLSSTVDSKALKKEKGITSPALTIDDLTRNELEEFNLSQETYL